MIPKVVHFSWVSEDILKSDHQFPKNTIQKMIELSLGWEFRYNSDEDIDQFLIDRLDKNDHNLIKDCHIVEKSDLWRIMKLYEEGGVYTDIDRLCNTSLNDIVYDDTMCVLPICAENDFSQDFMCSAPNNPIYLETFKLIMERRRTGHRNTYFLGPQTYMHGVTIALFGKLIDVNPGKDVFVLIKRELSKHSFIRVYREEPPYNTVLYRPENPQVDFDHEKMKRDFYSKCSIRHWTNEW
jgi:hypothetical protein